MRDMVEKGRCRSKFKPGDRRGVNAPNSILNDEKVREIRCLAKLGVSQRAMGIMFNVSRGSVGAILRGKLWSHVV